MHVSTRQPSSATLGLVLACGMACGLTATTHGRDWGDVLLAWRDDPRPAADVPAAAAQPQPERRLSRRAQRRAARRGQPLDRVTVMVPRQPDGQTLEGMIQPPTKPAVPLVQPLRRPPLGVETTLASPFAPDAAAATVASHRDQPYGSEGHVRQRFDMHLPAACGTGGLPLVVWIHGDDWASGTRADCPLLWLVEEGYAVASIGYRLSSDAMFPAQLDDCRTALATIDREAELWGIDRSRICVVGAAAGGHLAALLAFADADPAARPDSTGEPRADMPLAGVCAIAAPMHLTSLGAAADRGTSPASRLVGGPLPEFREAALAASPLEYVSADDPPTLLIHGRRDPAVDQSLRLERALAAAGVERSLVLLDGDGTRPVLERRSAAAGALREFLARVLGPKPAPGADR